MDILARVKSVKKIISKKGTSDEKELLLLEVERQVSITTFLNPDEYTEEDFKEGDRVILSGKETKNKNTGEAGFNLEKIEKIGR